MTLKAGAESSEYQEARRSRDLGWSIVALGIVTALAGAGFDRMVAAVVGVGLGAVGAVIVSVAVAAYAKSRGMAKAGAHAPVPQVTLHAPAQRRL